MKHLLVLAAIAGCAHTPDLALRPLATPPPGATVGTFVARDGTQLLTLHWAPAGEPRGVVVIMHGLKDQAANYAAFATRLTGAGYAVYAFDLRGHAHSAGPRVAPGRWLNYVDDLERFLVSVESLEPNRKVFVFGHSMGGAIATLAAMAHPEISGLVLSAPALAVDASPLLLAATRMAGALTPGAKALDLPNADFSSDPKVVKAISSDPMVEQGPGPARTAAGLVDGMRIIWANTHKLTMPLLALHGTRDALTAPNGSRALILAAPSPDKSLRIYDGFFHDLLHEPQGTQVEDHIVAWLDAHTGGDPVAPPPVFTGTLRGEPAGWTQAVELGAGVAEGIAFAGTAGLHLARPRPVGWHGALTAQWVGDYHAASLRPLGVAVRGGPFAFGVSAGGSVISGAKFALSAGAWAEIPIGPVHLGLLAERQRRVTNTNLHGPLASDQLWTSVSLRLGGERSYWPKTYAGVGPVVQGGMAWLADVHAWSITLGLQLYGAD